MIESNKKQSKLNKSKAVEKENEEINQEEPEVIEEIEDKDNQVTTKPEEITKTEDKYFSDIKFKDLGLSDNTLEALQHLNFQTATEVQSKCIPIALEGRDIIGSAKTGSGKSLAFLIPAVELLLNKSTSTKGESAKVLVLTPTRELALQLFNLTRDLLNYNNKFTPALIIGGNNRKVEAEKLKKGVSVIIATPGRLLDHMANTKGFNYSEIAMLVMDEADQILKIGFEKEMKDILGMLPKERQTLLFSATMTPKLEDLITLSLKDYIFVGVESKEATVSSLEQGYSIVDPDKKFLLLYTFIRKNMDKKIMVFLSSCKSVEYFSYLLNYVNVPNKCIHGSQKQQKRSTVYFEFCNSESGVLLCTDVAQRGLDFPDVDWIIQYDPPKDPDEYVHRVGRTARGAVAKGKALLILLPSEALLIRYLMANKITINEWDFATNKLAKIQDSLEKLVNKKDHFLLTSATDAYRAYLHSYVSNNLKDVFDVNKLDLLKICKSFGLSYPPMVHLNIRVTPSSLRRKKQKNSQGDKSYYSKGNDTNKNDSRQFVR